MIQKYMLFISVFFIFQSCIEVTATLDGDTPDENNSQPLHFFFIIHTGEGDCSFEKFDLNDSSQVSQFDECRVGLKIVSEELENLGVKAVFQFHGGFLEQLIYSEEKDPLSFSFKTDIVNRGHEIGLHSHTECLDVLDDNNICNTLPGENWGVSIDSDNDSLSPSADQLAIRHTSILQVLSDAVNASRNFSGSNYFTQNAITTLNSASIWGAPFQILEDLSLSLTNTVDLLLNDGINVLNTTGEIVVDWNDASSCYSGDSNEENSKYFSHPHPVELKGSSGSIYFYGASGELLGDPDVDFTALDIATDKHLTCMKERMMGNSYKNEIFILGSITHLHNMLNDENLDGVYDGIAQLTLFKNLLRTKVSSTTHISSLLYLTLAEIDSLRKTSEIFDGASYNFLN